MAWSWSGAGKGAATGGASGGIMSGGNPYAIGGGALVGGVIGGFSGGEQDAADKQRREAMLLAQQQQAIDANNAREQREIDLHRTMSLYGPALQSLEHLYGIPMSAWGPAAPGNSPPPTRAIDGPMSVGAPGRVISSLKKMGLWDQLTGAAPIPPGSPVIPKMQSIGALKPGIGVTPFKPAPAASPAPRPRTPAYGPAAWGRR